MENRGYYPFTVIKGQYYKNYASWKKKYLATAWIEDIYKKHVCVRKWW